MNAELPPHWPLQVSPPGSPEWEHSATKWLYDYVPADYRAYEVLRRYPVLLARMAGEQVAASLEAARVGWRTLRADVRDEVPPEAVEAAMRAYEREGRRLTEVGLGVAAVLAALRGQRWVPRL
ncbi:MAG: hypothetical protein ABJA34_01865 [Pseudonocardiales bacterium]